MDLTECARQTIDLELLHAAHGSAGEDALSSQIEFLTTDLAESLRVAADVAGAE